MKRISTCLIVVLLHFQVSAQCLMKELSLSQRSSSSELIIEGRVIAGNSFWNEDHSMIYTSNTVEILKIFKGQVTTSTIDVLTHGGTVGMKRIKVSPSLSLQNGMVGIFLCEPAKRFRGLPSNTRGIPRYEAYGAEQGFIKYDLNDGTAADPFNKYRSVQNELYKTLSPAMNYKVVKKFELPKERLSIARITAISGFSPTTITAGTGAVLTINGSGFGATQGAGVVQFRNADDGGATVITPIPSQYLSWSDAQITVEVPQSAGTGTIQVVQGVTFTSASPLTIDYAHSNVEIDIGAGLTAYQTDHINDNGTGGYTWRMNTAFDANTAANNSFARAFDSWRCGTGVNWTIGATTSVAVAADDGTNVITFDDADPLGPGFLGVCYSYWNGCTPNGTDVAWFVYELDIIFDDGDNILPRTWEFGTATPTSSEYDFETVALHELGHGHQLNHVISAGAVMHYALSNGSSNRTLSATDLAGGNFVQAKSETANVCGPGAMSEYAGCSALPINISSINAFQKENGVQVEWTNVAESDVDHYEVQESDNGSAFSTVANVAPQSNNHARADYEWFDAEVSNGSNFYRVKAVGVNGQVKYSSVATVNFARSSPTFSVYPNPGNGKNLTVSFNNLPKGTYTLAIYNSVGQRLFGKTLVHGGGNAVQNISLPGIAAGLYSVQLRGDHINEKPVMLTIR